MESLRNHTEKSIAQYVVAEKALFPLRPKQKTPVEEGWTTKDYSTEYVEAHFQAGGNLGWRLGAHDLVIDVDPRNGGDESFERLANALGLDLQPSVITPSGGVHYYLRWTGDKDIRKTLPEYPGIDFLKRGNYCLIAGCETAAGEYEWASATGFSQPAAPESLLNLLERGRGDGQVVDDTRAAAVRGILSPEQLEDILNMLPVQNYRDYHDRWLAVLMAAHHATDGAGLAEAIAWSEQDDEYANVAEEVTRKWDSFRRDKGYTIYTLLTFARREGYDVSRYHDMALAHEMDFELSKEAQFYADLFELIGEAPQSLLDQLDLALSEREAATLKAKYAPEPEIKDTRHDFEKARDLVASLRPGKSYTPVVAAIAPLRLTHEETEEILESLKEATGKKLAALRASLRAEKARLQNKEVGDYPDLRQQDDGTKIILGTTENIMHLVRKMGYSLATCQIRKTIVGTLPNGHSLVNLGAPEATLRASIRSDMYREGWNCSEAQLNDAVSSMVSTSLPETNPAADYIDACKQIPGDDHVARIVRCLNLSEHTTEKTAYQAVRAWMLAAVDAALNPNGTSNAPVLLLQGEQGIGKTEFGKALFPKWMSQPRGIVKTGVQLNPHNKDSLMVSLQNWVVEAAELEGMFKKSDVEAIKAFLSESEDSYRKPYARDVSRLPRRTVFWATANSFQLLNDPTGARRYLVLHLEDVNLPELWKLREEGIIEAAWAQVREDYRMGLRHHRVLSDNKAAFAAAAETARVTSEAEEVIINRFNWDVPRNKWNTALTATEALRLCGLSNPSLSDQRLAGAAITKATGRQNSGNGRVMGKKRAWLMPPLRNEFEDFDPDAIENLI